jgi:hypothetical protein
MALPSFEAVETELESIQTAIDALPGTPLEADLPDIVAVVASLQAIVTTIVSTIKSVRINQ